jgi:hypothetical protein
MKLSKQISLNGGAKIHGNGSRDLSNSSFCGCLDNFPSVTCSNLRRAKLNMVGAISNLSESSYFSIVFVNRRTRYPPLCLLVQYPPLQKSIISCLYDHLRLNLHDVRLLAFPKAQSQPDYWVTKQTRDFGC